MRNTSLTFLLACLLAPASLALNAGEPDAHYNVIPLPNHIEYTQGTTSRLDIVAQRQSSALPPSGYSLTLTPEGVSIVYGDKAGLDYALVTVEQLKDQLKAQPVGIPSGAITDSPAYPWRGMMADVARHYMPLADLKRFVDVMHFYKFNKLHLHLTDNQGWRLPVPGYPKLETIASKRAETEGNGQPHGGIYTAQELRELVAYCAERNIEVIPEIDVPGHNEALAAAYPEFFCEPLPELQVRTTKGNSKVLVCPAKKETYQFYNAVFDALQNIFPSSFVHLGGDEAPTDRWEACPLCRRERAASGTDTRGEMAAFFATLTDMLAKRGKTPQFWFENDPALYRKGQTVYIWRSGVTPATIDKTRRAGLRIILTPSDYCYLDFPQLPEHDNRGWMPVTTLKKSYQFRPDFGRSPEEVNHVAGVHCTLWAESLPTLVHTLYRAYPRAMAIAEAGWTLPQRRSWEDFQRRLQAHRTSYPARFKYTLLRTPGNEPHFIK